MKKTSHQKRKDPKQTALTIIGTALCIVLLPILIINLTLLAKKALNPDKVPSFGGWFPMVVLTDSMHPVIQSGDLIFCHTVDAGDLKDNDVITFFDPMGNGSTVVTHRIIETRNDDDGKTSFVTQGDNNNTPDRIPVEAEDVIGTYRSRIPGAGHLVIFMQTPSGTLLCCACPILLIAIYDALRRRKAEKEEEKNTAELLAELEALRAQNNRT